MALDRASGQRRNQKTSELVALEIVHDIVEQGLHVGDHLPLEAEMIEQYHVSRGSLREGLRLLEAQGLIRLKPGPRGGPVLGSVEAANLARTAMMYFQLSASTYSQLFETQALFEPMTAELAARHPARKSAMVRFTEAGPPPSETEYRMQTADFHKAVYGLANNPVLVLLTSAVTHIATDHVLATMDPVALRPAILHEHAAIAKTIAAGRPDKAGELMASHFQTQLDFYRQRWPARLLELVQWR